MIEVLGRVIVFRTHFATETTAVVKLDQAEQFV